MKLLTVLATTALSVSYRGGTFSIKSNADGTTSVKQIQTWATTFGQHGLQVPCLKDQESALATPQIFLHPHKPNKGYKLNTHCFLLDKNGYQSYDDIPCPDDVLNWPYIVESSSNNELKRFYGIFGGNNHDYCYGSYEQKMPTPPTSYFIGWSAQHGWPILTDDQGKQLKGQRLGRGTSNVEIFATVYDTNNNSPVYTHPPLWRVMAGCGQKIELNPTDPDGDIVRCRWAKNYRPYIGADEVSEAGGLTYDTGTWASLALDHDNCILHYNGFWDNTEAGLKGVGIIMEDYDKNGNVRSSIPVQFLIAVYTPSLSVRGGSIPGSSTYPDWSADMEDHHHDLNGEITLLDQNESSSKKKETRSRRSLTRSYCSAIPRFTSRTPEDKFVVVGRSFIVNIQAESDHGFIRSYHYEKSALEIDCSYQYDSDQNNPERPSSMTCIWLPISETEDQSLCFIATDSNGLTTERRCITLRIGTPSCYYSSYYYNSCHTLAKCSDTADGFECICPDGYEGDGIDQCDEINECTERTHTCNEFATCDNTAGSYQCSCNGGWQGNGFNCVNIDECAEDRDNCDDFATCLDNPGSFTCKCFDGYRGDGIKCSEIDECAEKTHKCDTNATCKNTDGSYNCKCTDGWRGDGFKCANIDECEENTHNCHGLAMCLDTPGSFECECLDGYEGDGVRKCRDINECTRKTHDCDINATCDNTVGSYNCTCNGSCNDNSTCNHNTIGWRGDGFKCNNIDECEEKTHNCHGFATCSDTLGSFECKCFGGYRGDGVKKCVEIDECAEGIDECHEFATCTNTPLGSYTCDCIDGYEGDGFNCVDINECETNAHTCHEFGFCTNTQGSYDCTCIDGYMGDGFLCTVPCATFFDTAYDGFMTNTSAFTTGTFDVTNLETFVTTPSQPGVSNWKPSAGFNNKASYVSVQPRCTLQGFTGMNFGGKKVGEWNGKFFILFRYDSYHMTHMI